jgi:hypothetical protein
VDLAFVAEGELEASPAQIDPERRPVAHGQPLAEGREDEVRLLLAGQQAHGRTQHLADPAGQLAADAGVAQRRGATE